VDEQHVGSLTEELLFLLASRGWTAAAFNGLCGFGGFYWCVRARTSVRVRVHVVRERCLPFVAER
jgi:hypothetical protein